MLATWPKPGLFLKFYEDYAPKTYAIISRIASVIDTPKYKQVLSLEYPKFEKISVDYGLFENCLRKSNGSCRLILVGLTWAPGNFISRSTKG